MNSNARNPVLVVAHTPGIPARYEALLRNISFLLSCENPGKSHECRANRMKMFLAWSKAEKCLFFEWQEEKEQVVCWMHNIRENSCIKFLVSPVIRHGINDVAVKQPVLSFSSGFDGDSWASVKSMLTTIFGSPKKKDLVEHDNLYVFTRIDSFICFRNYKIDDIPRVGHTKSPLVLPQVNPFFCFKLIDAQGNLNQVSDMSDNELHPTVVYFSPSDQPGSYTHQSVKLNNRTHQIFLKDDCNMSLLREFDGFNLPFDHLLLKEPASKIKPIIGSLSNKQFIFVRNRFKLILRSVVLQLRDLFASRKCLEVEGQVAVRNILIRGTDVKFYGLKIANYTDELAKENLCWFDALIGACFLSEMMPVEVQDAMARLLKSDKDPLSCLEELYDDCLWLRADERRTLLITHHSEYMTNFDIKVEPSIDKENEPDAGIEDESDADIEDEDEPDVDEVQLKGTFFYRCPYIDSWKQEAKDNEYLMQVCNLTENATQGSVKEATKGTRDAHSEKTQKKLAVNKRSKYVKKKQKRQAKFHRGIIQFDSMRNFGMHMPEKAMKDGIRPFRLGIPDYTLTSYYPRYLTFVHRAMSLLLRKRKLEKKATANHGD